MPTGVIDLLAFRAGVEVSMIFAKSSGDRVSALRSSRCLMPYSGPYSSRMARRRTSPTVLTASWTTWDRSTASFARGSIRLTAEAKIVHMSIATTCTASRQAGVAPAS